MTIKDYVRVTYSIRFPEGFKPNCYQASVLYSRDWWDRRKAETGDSSGRKVMDEAFRISYLCPYTVERLEIDEHPTV